MPGTKRRGIVDPNQRKILRRAKQNPMEAYFLGGFDLLSPQEQNKALKDMEKMFNRKK